MTGPLTGVTVLELSAIGPVPYGVQLLADLGADVVRVDRVAAARGNPGFEATMRGLSRNRRSVAIDLKQEAGRDLLLRLVAGADVLVEGFRPGVLERLGLGPDVLLEANPALVVARVTGWGQDGPMAHLAGHDIDYAAISGILHTVGRADDPVAPVNYLADFGGGGAFLAIGVLAALVERQTSGRGQVVDVAMVDGAASLSTFVHGLLALGAWKDRREANLLDGANPIYDTYRCADGGFVAVGAIEPQFHAELAERLGLEVDELAVYDESRWAEAKQRLAAVFAEHPRDHWAELFAGSDACVAPVLSLDEAPQHPHNVARAAFVEVEGRPMPAPAPRFSRTPGAVVSDPPEFGAHTDEVLATLGLDDEERAALRAADVIG